MEALAHKRPAFPGTFWHVPLMPVALAWTAGILFDRCCAVDGFWYLPLAGVFSLVWAGRRHPILAGLGLCGMFAAVGAWDHQIQAGWVAADDISRLLTEEAVPARVRGRVETEPMLVRGSQDPLRTFGTKDATKLVLAVEAWRLAEDWQPASGRVQATVPATPSEVHVGDVIEVPGLLAKPARPSNASDFDYAGQLRDQGIHAVLNAPAETSGVVVVARGWPGSLFGWLGKIRAWGTAVLAENLPREQANLATALLLGDGSGMTGDDWDKYMQTGVLHVLAISGQHLMVLALVLGNLLRLGRWRLASRTLTISLILFAYAILTGGRPPVMRAAWMMAVLCGGALLHRPVLVGNSFALAWLGVAVLNPADIFQVGCQMSFLAVLVLLWGPGSWEAREEEAIERVLREARPLVVTLLLAVGRWVVWLYVVNLLVWLAMVPLTALKYHLVSPIALLLGPPMVASSTVALVSGFVLLASAVVVEPLTGVFAWWAELWLWACEGLVDLGQSVPGGHFFVPDLPTWYVALFYLALIAVLTVPALRRRKIEAILAAATWMVGVAVFWTVPSDGNFRCTFLAVGHGGCTILEAPDGQVMLYDAGALSGPEVTRRHIAPFLWQRGRRQIDEVVVSHADLDHFNGLPALLDRFTVGRITTTPTFAERTSTAVRLTLDAAARRRIPLRQVKAGDRWQLGDLQLEVLHPPEKGPDGPENARSLVLAVEYQERCILLTGDLQEPGLGQVLSLPPRRVDVLMAPHHGSESSNTKAFADWAQPKIVISCQRQPLKPGMTVYQKRDIPFLGTWPHGTVTLRSEEKAWRVETFKTKKVLWVQ